MSLTTSSKRLTKDERERVEDILHDLQLCYTELFETPGKLVERASKAKLSEIRQIVGWIAEGIDGELNPDLNTCETKV